MIINYFLYLLIFIKIIFFINLYKYIHPITLINSNKIHLIYFLYLLKINFLFHIILIFFLNDFKLILFLIYL